MFIGVRRLVSGGRLFCPSSGHHWLSVACMHSSCSSVCTRWVHGCIQTGVNIQCVVLGYQSGFDGEVMRVLQSSTVIHSCTYG